jgi:hypothetical protein
VVDTVGVLYSLLDFVAPLNTTRQLVPLLEKWMPPHLTDSYCAI